MKLRSFSRILGFCLVTLVLADAAPATESDPSSLAQVPAQYARAVAESRRIIEAAMARQNIPGLSVAVAIDGKVIWAEGFGFADLENEARVTPQTRFRIASVSKLLTAAAAARLYESGRFDLDAPVQRYVPGFPPKEREITARQLLGHLSGIRHLRRNAVDESKDEHLNQKEHFGSLTERLRLFEDDPLQFTPGEKSSYSNHGFILLGAMLEGASGVDYLTLMQKEVFGPLDMPGSSADDNRKIVPHRTRFYSPGEDNQVINAPYYDLSYSWPSGGLLSTPEDLVRFGSAHLRAGFLKEATLREMFTSQKTADGEEIGIGFAWRIREDEEGRLYYYHPGEGMGVRAYLFVYPAEKFAVAMLCNLTGAAMPSKPLIKLFLAKQSQE